MGRSSDKQGSVGDQTSFWSDDELPRSAAKLPNKDFKSLQYPLWTQNKARLIQEYLRFFLYITKHGTYIDGFAAPQEASLPETWSAKLVLELEPKWLREFWLCDIHPKGIERLQALKELHQTKNRKVKVIAGDFNETVNQILASGRIKETTATFALLDQRAFECHWQTVVKLCKHKSETKIEQFYFFPTGWIDRSLAAVRAEKTIAKVEQWWGRDDWKKLQGMDGSVRAVMVAKRFEDELNYGKAHVYPIHSQRRGGRVMYHMIHATDHPEASTQMMRAYRKVSGRSDLEPTEIQMNFDNLLQRFETDED